MKYTNVNECLAGALEQARATLQMLTEGLRETDLEHIPCEGANSVRWVMTHLAEADRNLIARLGADAPDPDASFDEVRTRLIDAVRDAGPSELDREVDDMKLAGTLGSLLSLTALHTALHAGQISTIRRSLGYPPVF